VRGAFGPASIMTLDDDILAQKGLDPIGASGSVLLIACGALAREILDLKSRNNWAHLDLKCLPANLHLYPERIPGAVRESVNAHRDLYETIFVVYADCGTGGLLQKACDELGVEMIPGPHCYSFFEGNETFSAVEDPLGTFYLTDFLVRQFDAFVWRPMGLDRHPELRDMIFGHYSKLVYQAQTDDPALTEKAQICADRLGLAFERRFTGYGDLETALKQLG
jgi:hypothetical protein